MKPRWKELGKGSYNIAYRSADGKSVLKIRQNKNETDSPERSVRLWNAINPDFPARLHYDQHLGEGWVCPFISGYQASDTDMSRALIDIYNSTGRIVVDATAHKNFLRTYPPNSKVVCIDIGMAVQFERREEMHFSNLARRRSIVGINDFESKTTFDLFFKNSMVRNPETVKTVKALIFIKKNRPDMYNVSFLKDHPKLITKLADAYHAQKEARETEALKALDEAYIKKLTSKIVIAKKILRDQRPLSLDGIKDSCKNELQKYINSRGSINKKGEFEPSIVTKFFRDTDLTTKKVTAINELMKEIDQAGSLEKINEVLEKHFLFTPNTAIGTCLVIIQTTKNNPNYQLQATTSLGTQNSAPRQNVSNNASLERKPESVLQSPRHEANNANKKIEARQTTNLIMKGLLHNAQSPFSAKSANKSTSTNKKTTSAPKQQRTESKLVRLEPFSPVVPGKKLKRLKPASRVKQEKIQDVSLPNSNPSGRRSPR